ncbi:glycosyltransferase [Faecalimonas sp. LCP19S3_D12]
MGKKIKVCMVANSLEVNGVSNVIMNYCRNIDLNSFAVSIIVGTPVATSYRKECEDLGISIYELPSRRNNKKDYYLALNHLLKKRQFDIFHIHGGSALISIELFIARLHKINVRIAHSHNTTCFHLKTHRLLRPFFKHLYTHAFACGEDAGKWLFDNQKFNVIPNGFCVDRFRYNETTRRTEREKLGIEGKYVLGHIGRFNEQKNHKFLLEIFSEVANRNQQAVLLLVGTGPIYDEVMLLIDQHPYRERIITHEETAEPENLYNAMDIFVFPSLFEGLPVVLLEAQMTGLPCIVSDVITKEVDLGKNVNRLSLCEQPSVWAEQILENHEVDRKEFFEENYRMITRYEIKENVKILENLYKDACSEKC